MNDIKDKISFKRLKLQCLVDDIDSNIRTPDGDIGFYYNEFDYEITNLGEMLCTYGIKRNNNIL